MSTIDNLKVNQILSGHISPETAYVVEDYPYGFRLRCKIRYWLEYNPSHGCRLVSQTTDPRKSFEYWNKPKASTYARFGGCMFLDDENHVQWTGLTEYSDGAEAQAFEDRFGSGVPVDALPLLHKWVKVKLAYEAKEKENQQ